MNKKNNEIQIQKIRNHGQIQTFKKNSPNIPKIDKTRMSFELLQKKSDWNKSTFKEQRKNQKQTNFNSISIQM